MRHDLSDRADVEQLVRTFYRAAAMDGLLGPVFEAAHVNWSAHVATLIDFWSWQLLGEGGYTGQPLRAHEPVHARTPLSHEHYEQWVLLFRETVDELFLGPRAELAKHRGTKMAAAMERLLAGVSDRGDLPVEAVWTHRALGPAGSGCAPVHSSCSASSRNSSGTEWCVPRATEP